MELTTVNAHLLVYLALVCGHLVAAQQQQQQQTWQQARQDQLDTSLGERVDRLTSATGDLMWRPSAEQLEWMLQTQYKKPPAALVNGYYLGAPQQQADLVGLEVPASSYHALVDEFKQFSRLANPSRESRAFKPKLMSTARGFGKRALPGNQQVSLSDLLASSNVGAVFSDEKASGERSGSKYADWIKQVFSRWPTMDKYVNDKYVDYNGNI